MFNCYAYDEKISDESKAGKQTAEGNFVIHNSNYRMIDVLLSDGERTVAYATPVCVYCLEQLLKKKECDEDFFRFTDRVIEMNRKYDCGPRDFLNKELSVIELRDLTEQLIKEGIIQCQ